MEKVKAVQNTMKEIVNKDEFNEKIYLETFKTT